MRVLPMRARNTYQLNEHNIYGVTVRASFKERVPYPRTAMGVHGARKIIALLFNCIRKCYVIST